MYEAEEKKQSLKGRVIVGIDGWSRSGKTTFVHHLCQRFEEEGIHTVVFHLDDHIVNRKDRYQTGYPSWQEYYYFQWKVKWLQEHLFRFVREKDKVCLPYYASDADDHQWKETRLPEACVIFIEGVFLQREEWRTFLDYVVFLDCDRDVRFQRESSETQKDIHKFRERYWPAEDHYLLQVDPTGLADHVIDTTGKDGCSKDENPYEHNSNSESNGIYRRQ
ncbi:UNVERIFIED_CONTAM: kinase [Halobacillus marinus]